MELNWTTFILETVNFLVLVWILNRLFYGPVRRIIAERRIGIEKRLQDAVKTGAEAGELRLKYENRLKDWQAEKAQERAAFQKDLEAEKDRQMKLLEKSLQDEKEKIQAQEQKRAAELLEKNQKEAVRQSLAFLSRFIAPFASAEVEAKIVEMTLQSLSDPASPQRGLLQSGLAGGKEALARSAFGLGEEQKRRLGEALKAALNRDLRLSFEEKPELLAGLEVVCGSAVLQANLRDELSAFARAGRHD